MVSQIVTLHGALTATAYQFKGRPWELKTTFSFEVNSLEYTPTLLSIKNEFIMRILPKNGVSWLTDSSRYFFRNFISSLAFNLSTPIFCAAKLIVLSWAQLMNFFSFLFKKVRKVGLVSLMDFFLYSAYSKQRASLVFKVSLGELFNTKTLTFVQNTMRKLFGVFYLAANRSSDYYGTLGNEVLYGNTLSNSILSRTLFFGDVSKRLFADKLPLLSLRYNNSKSKNSFLVQNSHFFSNLFLYSGCNKNMSKFYIVLFNFFMFLGSKINIKNFDSVILASRFVQGLRGISTITNNTFLTTLGVIDSRFTQRLSGFLNSNNNVFVGGKVDLSNFGLLRPVKSDYLNLTNMEFFITNSVRKVTKYYHFEPLKGTLCKDLLRYDFGVNVSNYKLILPTHIYYSQEFCVGNLFGEKKMQKYSQIFLLSQAQKLKSVSLILESLYKLIYLRQKVTSFLDEVLLTADTVDGTPNINNGKRGN